jgi:hypothetical protein
MRGEVFLRVTATGSGHNESHNVIFVQELYSYLHAQGFRDNGRGAYQ